MKQRATVPGMGFVAGSHVTVGIASTPILREYLKAYRKKNTTKKPMKRSKYRGTMSGK